MKKIHVILILLLLPFMGKGQNYLGFCLGRLTDTAKTNGSLLIPAYVRLPQYATSDTNKVLGLNSAGLLELRTKGNGSGTTVDTSSLSARIDARVKYTDTAAMLSPYYRTATATAALATKQAYSDTNSYDATKTNLADTSALLRTLISGSVSGVSSVTATAPLASSGGTTPNITADTAVLSTKAWRQKGVDSLNVLIAARVKYTDTAAMLTNYARKSLVNDTAAAIRAAIPSVTGKVNYTDTAAMLANYAKIQRLLDTASAIQSRLNLKLNIANPTATGTLTTPALTISSLTAGSTSDSVVTVNAATGVLYRRAFPSSGGGGSGFLLTGNTVASVPLLGTLNGYNVDFIANNLRLGRFYYATYSFAWGEGASATGFWGSAGGYGATASGQHGVSYGSYTEASDVGSTALGYSAKSNHFASWNLSCNGGYGPYVTALARQGVLGADTRIDHQITPGVNILSVTADNVISNKPVSLKSYTVAGLPSAAANTGAICYVTDASAPTYNATVTGGGSVLTLVFSNGTNWTCH